MVQWWNDHDDGARAFTSLSANGLSMNGNKITNLGAGVSATDGVNFGQVVGTRILQIASSSTTSGTNSATTTFTASSISCTITPSSTFSSIAIIVTTACQPSSTAPSTDVYVSIFRGNASGTNLGDATKGLVVCSASLTVAAADQWWIPCTIFNIDTPSTASAQTYTVCYRGSNATNAVGVGVGGGLSFMYLLEIR
jgi:hypothetical protein